MAFALRRAWAKDLAAATLYELLKLRVEVFVVEHACPYPELDDAQTYLADLYAHHGFTEDGIAHVPMLKSGFL